MTTLAEVSLQEYLNTSYDPDVDYVDGELEERNVGEYDHSSVQQQILMWFYIQGKEWGIRSVIEQRTRVAANRVRIPDVSVFSRSTPTEQVFSQPQLIAVEVLSPEDPHSRMDRNIRNYMDFGVANIWIVDPKRREGWDCSDGNWLRKARFEVADSPIYLSLEELFKNIDEDAAD